MTLIRSASVAVRRRIIGAIRYSSGFILGGRHGTQLAAPDRCLLHLIDGKDHWPPRLRLLRSMR